MATLWARLVRFGFHLLYHQMAWSYDLVSMGVSFGQWRAWTQQALPFLNVPSGAPVLELAHGPGSLHLDLHAAGLHAVGLDLSPQMGRIAQAKLRRANFPARLVRGRAGALPFADAAFAAVVCTFPTPFILEAQMLREARRVLEPGGRFVIVPNAVLTGGDAATAAVEWLYRITGQRGETRFDVAAYFADYGFAARVESVRLSRSQVMVIVAEAT